jgi:hypothetical protein
MSSFFSKSSSCPTLKAYYKENIMNHKEFTAPCGIDCFNCEVFESNLTEENRARFSAAFKLAPEAVACKGCRASGGCRLHWGKCDTLDCVKDKGIEFCHECTEFPCAMLCPSAESAQRYPHNLKLYNLCRMKQLGIEKWAQEAAENRKRYFKGMFVVGKGPVIEQ